MLLVPLLLLQAGWGKRLSYVVAVGRHGAVDVTRRYTRKWEEVQQRWGCAALALAPSLALALLDVLDVPGAAAQPLRLPMAASSWPPSQAMRDCCAGWLCCACCCCVCVQADSSERELAGGVPAPPHHPPAR